MGKFSCDFNPKGDKYIFYQNIDKYLKYGKFCNNVNNFHRYGGKCEFKGLTYDGKENVQTDICKRFKCLIHNILKEVPEHNSPIEEADGEYLNYWLNREIHLNNANICPINFYQHMITMDTENKLRKLRNYMYYIEDDDVNNMNVLYLLYNNYKEMNEIIDSDVPTEKTFMTYAKNCVEKYKSLDIQCNRKHTDFCDYLSAFKKKYDKINLNIDKLKEWDNKTLPSLNNNEPPNAKITRHSLTNGEYSEIVINHRTPGSLASVMQPTPLLRVDKYTGEDPKSFVTASDPSVLYNNHSPQNIVVAPTMNSHSFNDNPLLANMENKELLHGIKQTELNNEDDLGVDKKIIGTIITTLGVPSFFFIFYKFTSLGSYLRRRTNSKKKLMHDFDEKGNNFLGASEYQHIYPDRESYKIAYNSG
ncbi:PIR protein [Plasmodium vivax]|uniref:VIR protein n=1 Tax=Plasmodium vivax TaxID=5855 RepID=A0A565A6D5_PLAVI|nr:PIR protein [Plasmodium vivax]